MFKVKYLHEQTGSKNFAAAAPPTSSIMVRRIWLCESPNAQNSYKGYFVNLKRFSLFHFNMCSLKRLQSYRPHKYSESNTYWQ